MFKITFNQTTGMVDLTLELGIPLQICATVSLATKPEQLPTWPSDSCDSDFGYWRLFGRHSGETPRLNIADIAGAPVIIPQIAHIKVEILGDPTVCGLISKMIPKMIADTLQVFMVNPADLAIGLFQDSVTQIDYVPADYPAEWPIIPDVFKIREMVDPNVLRQLGFIDSQINRPWCVLPINRVGPDIQTYEYPTLPINVRFCINGKMEPFPFQSLPGIYGNYRRLPDGTNESCFEMTGRRKQFDLPGFGRVEGQLTTCRKLLVDTIL